jgi:hypothetical protein
MSGAPNGQDHEQSMNPSSPDDLGFAEPLYLEYLEDPNSVDSTAPRV